MHSLKKNSKKDGGINDSNNGEVIPKTLYERYEYLFGADPTPPSNDEPKGTIGALNTYLCLPRELGYTDEELNIIISNTKISIDEFKAAIVFTVFARMLDISLYEKNDLNYNKYQSIHTNYNNYKSNGLFLDGVLAHYLIKTPCVGYIDGASAFYLFAHGGVSLDFINNDVVSFFDNINAKFKINNYNLCKKSLIQSGGNKIEKTDFISKINKFNEEVSKLMTVLLTNPLLTHSQSQNALDILITLCVPNNDIIATTGYDAKMSPILAFLPTQVNILENVITNGKDVYSFFGHIPNGCGYGFYRIGASAFNISTDFSASLFSSNIIFGKENSAIKSYNNNNLLLKLDTNNGNLKLEGDIHININEDFKLFPKSKDDLNKLFNEIYNAGKIDPNSKDTFSGIRLFHNKELNEYKSLHIKFNDNSSIQDQLYNFNEQHYIQNPNIVFHGHAIVNIDNHAPFKAEIFSIKNGLHKELVINYIKSIKEGMFKKITRLLTRTHYPHEPYVKADKEGNSSGGARLRYRKSKLRKNKLKLKTRINKKRNLKNHTKHNTSKA
jgi:hypothetical protein